MTLNDIIIIYLKTKKYLWNGDGVEGIIEFIYLKDSLMRDEYVPFFFLLHIPHDRIFI